MNKVSLKEHWPQVQSKIRSWWSLLADSDVDRIAGDWDELVDVLQEKYFYTREHAEEEIKWRLREYEAQRKGGQGTGA
jgi:hypothetical protein